MVRVFSHPPLSRRSIIDKMVSSFAANPLRSGAITAAHRALRHAPLTEGFRQRIVMEFAMEPEYELPRSRLRKPAFGRHAISSAFIRACAAASRCSLRRGCSVHQAAPAAPARCRAAPHVVSFDRIAAVRCSCMMRTRPVRFEASATAGGGHRGAPARSGQCFGAFGRSSDLAALRACSWALRHRSPALGRLERRICHVQVPRDPEGDRGGRPNRSYPSVASAITF